MSSGRELSIWTVYDSPLDAPGKYVARLFKNDKPQDTVIVSGNIQDIQDILYALGLMPIARSPEDEEHIMGSWL